MTFLLAVLKILGVVLLVVVFVILLNMLFVLFIPFGYTFAGRIEDPEGSEEPLHLDLHRDISCSGEVRWLLGALRVRAAYEGTLQLRISFLGFTIPVSRLLDLVRGRKRKEREEGGRPPEPKEKKNLQEMIEDALKRIERLYARVDDAIYVLGTESGRRARQTLLDRFLCAASMVLPRRWEITGTVGLGDPAWSAKVFAVQGILYPVTAGHVAVGTEFELYRYDLSAMADGEFMLIHIVFAALRIMLDRNIRRVLGRLRRGPRPEGAPAV